VAVCAWRVTALRPGVCAMRENAHTRPTLSVATSFDDDRVPRNVQPAVRRACVLLPSGAAVRPVGGGGGAAVTVLYRARSVRCRLLPHPSPKRCLTGDRVAAAVVVPSSPRQLRRRRERRGLFFQLTAAAAWVHYTATRDFTLTREQCKNHPTPLFRCSCIKRVTITPSGSPPASTNPVRCSLAYIPSILLPSTDAR